MKLTNNFFSLSKSQPDHIVRISASKGEHNNNRDGHFVLTNEREEIVVLIVGKEIKQRQLEGPYYWWTYSRTFGVFAVAIIVYSVYPNYRRTKSFFIKNLLYASAVILNQPIRIDKHCRTGKILFTALMVLSTFSYISLTNVLYVMLTVQSNLQPINSIQELRSKNIPVFLNKEDIYNSVLVKEDIT